MYLLYMAHPFSELQIRFFCLKSTLTGTFYTIIFSKMYLYTLNLVIKIHFFYFSASFLSPWPVNDSWLQAPNLVGVSKLADNWHFPPSMILIWFLWLNISFLLPVVLCMGVLGKNLGFFGENWSLVVFLLYRLPLKCPFFYYGGHF